MRWIRNAVGALALIGPIACGEADDGTGLEEGTGGTGLAGSGGAATGGAVGGGAMTGGRGGGSATGGVMTGGVAGGTLTGGVSTGGVSTGGSATGGAATGGATSGGVANGGTTTGGAGAGGAVTGGVSTGGTTTGGVATGGVTTGGAATGGASTGGNSTGGAETGGAETGGAETGGGGTGGSGTGGSGACDVSEPPSEVAAWIEESWQAEGDNNILNRSAWLFDAAMKGGGEINVCVRWGATESVSTATRDAIAPALEGWFNEWFSRLYPYACFPYPSVTVRVTGWAVRPGQESLLQWSDGTVPVYTEQENGSDPPGEPKCPDSCGFFFNWDHDFSSCPGGAANHFDYSLWLDDDIPGSAAAVGGDWGLRMPVGGFLDNLDNPTYGVVLHEMGHGFGLSDYYSWTGSRPEGGSIMIVGSSSGGLTLGDQWIVRRYFREAWEDRYQ